jgi:hypothetical protein
MKPTRSFSLALTLALLASTSHAMACGGGGSGSYRKPARPGQHHHSRAVPSSKTGSTTTQGAPQ